jgi:hypothetical protein
MKKWLLLLGFITVLFFSCKQKQHKPVVADITINKQTSFNNLFFDSIRLEKFLEGDSSFV